MEKSNYFYGLTKFWWVPVISGLVLIGFGIWCLCDPSSSLKAFAYVFASCIGAVGLFNVIFALCNTKAYHGWGFALSYGIVEIICSVWLLCLPAPTLTMVFMFAIGLYIIIEAVNSICETVVTPGYSSIMMAWLLILLLVAIVFGFIFIAGPIGTGIAVWLWIGISLICYGVYRIFFASKLYEMNKNFQQ